jgi:hypothetical protein
MFWDNQKSVLQNGRLVFIGENGDEVDETGVVLLLSHDYVVKHAGGWAGSGTQPSAQEGWVEYRDAQVGLRMAELQGVQVSTGTAPSAGCTQLQASLSGRSRDANLL